MIRNRNVFRQEYKRAEGWWEDLVFPAAAVGTGGASPPDVDSNNGTLLFASNITEEVFIQAQLPHKWLEGSKIEPHTHWSKTTSASGGVVWKIDYEWANVGDTFTNSLGTTLELDDIEVADADTAHLQAIHAGNITDVAKKISSIILIRLYRDHDDTGDTYGADARLYQFDIHYQIDQPGSTGEYTKWDS